MKKNYEEEIKKLKQQKLLYQLKDEIDTLEKEIKYQKIKNLKISIIRNSKITANTIRAITPYTISLMLVTGGFKAITGGYPFICDNEKKIPASITREIDSLGNINETKKYTTQTQESQEIYLYKNWKYNDIREEYIRNIELYELNNLDEKELENLITLDETELTELFGNPEYYSTEAINTLNKEEKRPYIKIITTKEDNNDYITKKETLTENIIGTVVYLYSLIIAEFTTLLYATVNQKNNYREKNDIVKMNYPYINKEINIKKLEIKKENYNRLTRE